MKTYICGHKNPDTDSVISAIALANFLGDNYLPAIAGEPNKETVYILSRFGLDLPKTLPEDAEKIILVDHNSPDEASELVTPEKIEAIYDHHRLGGCFTADPAPIRIEILGSTCSLVAKMYAEKEEEISKNMAGALICGVLSDTLNFTSPITTDEDKAIVERLNKTAGIDIEKTAEAMFLAKSDISGISTDELITKDYKVFEMSGQKVGIGVWETVKPEAVLARKPEIINALEAEKEKSKLDYIFFGVIDILSQVGYFLIASEKEHEVAEAVFKGVVSDGVLEADGVVSRKKQIVPPLEKYFS